MVYFSSEINVYSEEIQLKLWSYLLESYFCLFE